MFNPIEFLQNYLINWIDASRGFYKNAIRASEYWFKAFWGPWLRTAGLERKKDFLCILTNSLGCCFDLT